jgi:hypothetical protein
MTVRSGDRRSAKGRRALAAGGYDKSVFINCPFDGEFMPVFRAIVFTAHECGFPTRCSLELDDSSEVRIEKITRIIGACRLGIHDISRVELDETTGLPRFNMPFELGLFLGAKRFGDARQRRKVGLILDRERYRYQKFLSDIAGQDIQYHSGDYAEAIREVRDWLQGVKRADDRGRPTPMSGQEIIPGSRRIVGRYDRFCRDLPLLCEEAGHDESRLKYPDFLSLIEEWQSNNDPAGHT